MGLTICQVKVFKDAMRSIVSLQIYQSQSSRGQGMVSVWLFCHSLSSVVFIRQKDVGPEKPSRGVADEEVCLFKLLQNSHPISGQLTTSTYLELLWASDIFVSCKGKRRDILILDIEVNIIVLAICCQGVYFIVVREWWESGLSRIGREQCLEFLFDIKTQPSQ